MSLKWLQLMRIHKPAGSLLLFAPTAWALWLANQGAPSLHIFLLFLFGTIIMRSAGCVINDIVDRNFDQHVKRTKFRPLTTGEVSLPKAWLLLITLFLLAFDILVQLPKNCFYFAIAAVCITMLYPFCKRFFHSPQIILSLAFSMGIPIACVASAAPINLSIVILFILNMLWIIAYDTQYALADREDDLRIGIKSTAIVFAHLNWQIILLLQILFHSLWLWIAVILKFNHVFYLFWSMAILILVYQQILLQTKNPIDYLRAFSSNIWYGICMWIALILVY